MGQGDILVQGLQIADDLEERRERFGISAIGLSASSLDDLAPLISRLAGT